MRVVCRSRSTLVSLITLVALLLVAAAAFGQASYTAQVRGTVKDQSGALVPHATITITNDATGIVATAQTDEHGLYILTGLRPAVYTIKAEGAGFRAAEEKDVVLQVDQQTSIDFSLHPLGLITTVEVTEAAPLLDTESASLGTDVTNEYLRDIPLYNRSMFGLVFLAGGVTETTGSGVTDNYPSGTNFVSNGQRNATAEVSLDGSPISAPEQGEGGNSNVYYQPSVEIVQEFKVQNNSFSAEFGNNGGTVVNMVLKQGGNAFHGSGWWYGQRSAFDARDYFNSGPKPDHLRDQYGFAVGGPIQKNKTFFFVDFEKSRQQDPINIEGVVPTDLERTGDFSQSLDSSPGGIFDPSTCALADPSDSTCTRTQFPGNVITNIDPVGQAIINLYPHANIDGATFPDPNFRTVVVTSDPGWQFDAKIDHQFNSKHRIAGRYSRHHDVFTAPNVIGSGDFGDGSIYTTTAQNGGLEYNWSVTPTLLWTSRLSEDRVVAPGQTNGYPTLSDVGLPPILASNGLTRIPSIQVDDSFLSIYTQCCVDTHFAHTLTSYSSVLQWVKGRHSIKFGGEQRNFLNNFWQPNYPTGSFNFSRDVTTSQPGQGLGESDTPEGNPFATILTGFAHDAQLNIVPAVADESKETAFYVQDDWKVTPKLTINVGLRYEWSTPYSERYNRLQFSDFTASTGISVPVSPAPGFPEIGSIIGTTVFPTSSKRNSTVDRNNFAPRFGFAYQLAANTVVRGGAGVYYGMNVATNFQYAGPAFQKSANIYFTKDNYQTQYACLGVYPATSNNPNCNGPFPGGLSGAQGTKYGSMAQWGYSNASDLDTGKARNAEIYQWNLGIQHLLPGQIVIGIDYSANRSTHLPWAGAGGISTRDRNFISTATRNLAISLTPPNSDPTQPPDVTGFLNTNVPNPFQCFFVTVASPGSWCPATPTFAASDVVDSRYLDDTIPLINLLRPYPQYDGNFEGLPKLIATSWYNSLQVRFQKRASHYISFEGNYTFSKSTDDSSAGRNAWIGNLYLDNPQVLDDLKAEHGISSNDATHRLVAGILLDLPFGRGRWVGRGMNRAVDSVIGGWSLYSTLTLQSGQPLAIYDSAGLLADGNQRPDVICSQLRTGISYKEAAQTGNPYLNQDCFTNPGDNVPGNAPRHFSELRGDGIRNLDMSLSKEFTFHEDMKMQIRAEAFNVANHQRFGFPDVGSGDGSFGGVYNTTNNFRRMQFGARFQF
jgi:Carboxypeptidase regulatory-like domain/TonB dependent receptor